MATPTPPSPAPARRHEAPSGTCSQGDGKAGGANLPAGNTNGSWRELLLHGDGSLKGGTLHRVLQHVVWNTDVESVINLLHGYVYGTRLSVSPHALMCPRRQFASPSNLLKELSTVFQERLDLGIYPEETVLQQLQVFLTQWIDLYFTRDFPRQHWRRRRRLLRLVERLPLAARNSLKLLVLRRCAAELPTTRPAATHQAQFVDAIKRSNSLPPEAPAASGGGGAFGTLRRLRGTRSGSYTAVRSKSHTDVRRSLTLAAEAEAAAAADAKAAAASILLSYKAEEIARQLALIEFQLFVLVKPSELMDNTWQRPDKHVRAPFVTAMIGFANKVTNWIEKEVVGARGTRQVTALERAIELTERCRELRNYNAMMEVHSALSQASIVRLKAQWARVDPKWARAFAEHEELLTPVGNFRKYRALLAELDATQPTLPYIGLFLRDTLFANEGNRGTLDEAHTLINWDRLQIVGHQISNLTRYQAPPFAFPVHLELQERLRSLPRPDDDYLGNAVATPAPAPTPSSSSSTPPSLSAGPTPVGSTISSPELSAVYREPASAPAASP